MEALGLVAVAAVFGYFATIVVRRYEVLRSIAVQIDDELQEALNAAIVDTLDVEEEIPIFETVIERLGRASVRAASLPTKPRRRILGQIDVAGYVATYLLMYAKGQTFELVEDRRTPQAHLGQPLLAIREVLAPLLLPPPLLGYRRPAQPRSYPGPESFEAMKERTGDPGVWLEEALEHGRRHGSDYAR